ncbi:MAG: hypothetical protein R2911_25090 [Caldilineaceae bacterium]
MLLGFVMIWAYFSFSQFLIIWSANIPEEAVWYFHRTQGGWKEVTIVLVALHFVLPFLLLLARGLKRSARWLTALAIFIFVARLLDLFWQIMPAFTPPVCTSTGWIWRWCAPSAAAGSGSLCGSGRAGHQWRCMIRSWLRMGICMGLKRGMEHRCRRFSRFAQILMN